jgi:hypothetical protein
MVAKQAALPFAVFAMLLASSGARGDDVDDLKATFEQGVKVFNARDFSTFVKTAHDQVILFGHFPPLNWRGEKHTARDTVRSLISTRASFSHRSTPNSVLSTTLGLPGDTIDLS